MSPVPRPPRERFHDNWIGEPNSGCWLWTGDAVANSCGSYYGRLWIAGVGVRAHRFSWELHKGPIPEGLFVLHGCDTPLCVNPQHLFLGTKADNTADMFRKGRQPKAVKLNPALVAEVRASEISTAELASRFGVSRGSVAAVRRGETWRHIT